VNISEADAALIARMRKPVWLIVFVGAFVGLIVWPLLSLPANVFSLGYFRFYVVLTFVILILASLIGIFLPIWEARGTAMKVFQWRVRPACQPALKSSGAAWEWHLVLARRATAYRRDAGLCAIALPCTYHGALPSALDERSPWPACGSVCSAGARDGAQGPAPARQVFVEMLERSFRGGSRSGRSGSFFGKGAGSRDATAHGPDGKAGVEQNGAMHADDSAKHVPVAPKPAVV
jgi:hypothetical protein